MRREFHGLIIRPAEPGDDPLWAELLTRLHPGSPVSEFESDIAHWRASAEPFICFLALAAGEAAGFIDARVRGFAEGAPGGRAAYVEDLWIAPAVRRSGLASRLLGEVEQWARGLGLDWLGSDTVPENRASRRWHAANGFAQLERLVVFGKPLR